MCNLLSNIRKNADYIKFVTLSANHTRQFLQANTAPWFDALLEALQSNTTLQGVSCHAAFCEVLSADQIRQLWHAVCSIPSLRQLTVALPANRKHLSHLVVEACVAAAQQQQPQQQSSLPLSQLVLHGFDAKACEVLVESLPHLSSLRHLQLVQGEGASSSALVAVSGHSPPLQSSPDDQECPGVGPLGVLATALLGGNNNNSKLRLETLVLSSPDLKDADVVALADALASNTALEHLDLRWHTRRTTAAAPFAPPLAVNLIPLLQVLQESRNETLTRLETDAPLPVQTQLHFYTQLNALGATPLLRQDRAPSDDQWVDLLVAAAALGTHSTPTPDRPHEDHHASSSSSLSLVYHILLQDPHFLRSYAPERDPDADERPLEKPTTQPQKSSPASSLLPGAPESAPRVRRQRLRKKAAHPPRCYQLNAPMMSLSNL